MTRQNIPKRSLKLWDKETSVSLEPYFWNHLQAIAKEKDLSVRELIEQIDLDREDCPVEQKNANLSSACRIFVSKHFESLVKLKSAENDPPSSL